MEFSNHEVKMMELNGNQAQCSQENLNTVMVEDYVALHDEVPVVVSNKHHDIKI